MIIGNFRIDIVGDLEYEDLIADVYFNDQIVAVITQESGYENMEIEIYPPKIQKFWLFKMSEFESAIQYAKKRLWELRKIS
jgi:hypothetical protein